MEAECDNSNSRAATKVVIGNHGNLPGMGRADTIPTTPGG